MVTCDSKHTLVSGNVKTIDYTKKKTVNSLICMHVLFLFQKSYICLGNVSCFELHKYYF